MTTATQERKVNVTSTGPHLGLLWFAGWLFTIGFAKLGFWKAVFALVVWPYYLALVVGH